MKKFTVGITYNLKTDYQFKKGDPADANAEFDSRETLNNIINAISSNGHKVIEIGSAFELLKRRTRLKDIDIVFNIAEGLRGRNRESEVPVILEMLGVPFVGSDGLTLGLTLDKILTKKILKSQGIPTPDFLEVNDASRINGTKLKYPLIVKPRGEGTSKGLSERSVVKNRRELQNQTSWLIDTYKQPALIEEFIMGKEFTVAIIGNKKPEVFPVVQVKIDGKLDLRGLFYTFSRVSSNTLSYLCPAKVSKRLERRIKEVALATYQAVECRDFGRVDVRTDEDDNPYVLEINPLPSLSVEDVFMLIPKTMGRTYNDMVNKILNEALKRYGMI